jgi:ATP-dependent DNA helicase RecG
MTAAPRFSAESDIALVVGPGRVAEAFRRLGLARAIDLVRHLPLRYEHELPEQTIAQAERTVPGGSGSGTSVAVRGEVAAVRLARARRSRLEATLEDGSGRLMLVWFNAPWLRDRIHPGLSIRAWGPVRRRGAYLQMVNPRWSPADGGTPAEARPERYRPVYPASESLSSEAIERAVGAVLDDVVAELADHLPPDYRRRVAMPELAQAYRLVHRPADRDEAAAGRRRLAFDELFLLELGVMLKRQHRRRRLRAIPLRWSAALDEHIRARFPFELTRAQRRVMGEIAADLVQPVPMNRLLQGDVASGKTVVALYAMLVAVADRHQAVLMAPTELLAEQHHRSIAALLRGGSVRVELLVGSLGAAERRRILELVAAGEIDILVGTHALLTEAVSFRGLALAVIDEQHRFGVHQRATLRSKSGDADTAPHVLVMTATPIPRTLSLTVFGDLDVSIMRELPPGRQPIITRHVGTSQRQAVYGYVAERLGMGDQAYVVVPVIEESATGLRDLESHLEWLRAGPLHGRVVEPLHGRMSRGEREATLERFRGGAVAALVATTVIEVGVDIAAAGIMVIEQAERFGLAQLHQLRGRVGRGRARGLCVLIADPATGEAAARLKAITSTTDGFVIAEKDLEIRGPGELFGARQAGIAPFRVAELPRDFALLRLARSDAARWARENPTLSGERDALLKKRLLETYGEALRLGDVA